MCEGSDRESQDCNTQVSAAKFSGNFCQHFTLFFFLSQLPKLLTLFYITNINDRNLFYKIINWSKCVCVPITILPIKIQYELKVFLDVFQRKIFRVVIMGGMQRVLRRWITNEEESMLKWRNWKSWLCGRFK